MDEPVKWAASLFQSRGGLPAIIQVPLDCSLHLLVHSSNDRNERGKKKEIKERDGR
jgi:hypothetical protein